MNTIHHSSEDFSLSEGSPIHDAMVKVHLPNKHGKLAVAGLCIAWLPLVIITAIGGTLYSGTQLPFLQDVAMQARILVALPMLIMMKISIDSKVIVVTKYLTEALISPEERQEILNTAFRQARKLTSSALAEIILLLIVIGATINFVKGGVFGAIDALYGQTTSWMYYTKDGNQTLSIAGYWAILISIPIFQFLLLRWLWRYFIWMLLLFRLSKAKLNLLPTHADRAGGLGIVMIAQRSFIPIFVAGSVVISGQFIARIIQDTDSFNTIRVEVIGYIVICIIFLLIPLLFFTGKLSKTKNEGLLHLSNLGVELSRKFEREWVNDLSIEKRIEEQQVDPSLVFDYAGMYESVQQLRTIPVTLQDIIRMGITLFVPFIPILFIHFSAWELLQKIVGLVA